MCWPGGHSGQGGCGQVALQVQQETVSKLGAGSVLGHSRHLDVAASSQLYRWAG